MSRHAHAHDSLAPFRRRAHARRLLRRGRALLLVLAAVGVLLVALAVTGLLPIGG